MKIVIIPDVHGRQFWTKIKDRIDEFDKIIFLGDYLDQYPNELISNEDSIANFQEILEFAEENPNKVILLKGNHDEFYTNRNRDCCRHDYGNWGRINALFNDYKYLFKYGHIENGVLFTHAGVTSEWIWQNDLEYLNESNIEEFLNSNPEEIWQIGESRGGYSGVGSPIWCCAYGDWPKCHNPFNLIQIFGHSQQWYTGTKMSFCNNTCHCIDSRAIFIWENNELKLLEL